MTNNNQEKFFKLFAIGYTHTFLQFYHSYSTFNTETTLLTDFLYIKIYLFWVT